MGNGMNKILPGLFVGNIRDAKDAKQLEENKITHILSIHDNAKPVLEGKEYLCISASDTPEQNLTPFFHQCTKFIHEARLNGGVVLVHCLAGVSRSVTVTVAYIMVSTNHNHLNTLNAVRHARTVANPNFGFQKQLQKFQEGNLKQEREWFLSTYGPNPFNDQEIVQSLFESYEEEMSQDQLKRPQTVPSGSNCASSYPLNRRDNDPSEVAWTQKRRQGCVVDNFDN
uniref:Dual specificity protein phosphatase 15 n=1 Tax=Phallusia mammillata TaxID=59560 RepID=A0A6F9DAR5_9ASCI|nr:dual specificity protein phosphatase 22-like [Phallusia mammillata]